MPDHVRRSSLRISVGRWWEFQKANTTSSTKIHRVSHGLDRKPDKQWEVRHHDDSWWFWLNFVLFTHNFISNIFLINFSVFPVTTDVPFPKTFLHLCRKILTRLFRVFVHVYIHHFDRIVSIGAVSQSKNASDSKFESTKFKFAMIRHKTMVINSRPPLP